MRSERGLTEALRTHLRLSGLPSLSRIAPVRKPDGSSGRFDLHLGVKAREHERIRHLVIELKHPSIELTRQHMDQVRDYCNTILDEPRFADSNSHWDFMLVGRSMHAKAKRDIDADALDAGLFMNPHREDEGAPHVRAYVTTWRQLIDENMNRLKFVREALEDDPSVEAALEYLRRAHAAALPEHMQSTGQEKS